MLQAQLELQNQVVEVLDSSNPAQVASAIIWEIRGHKQIELRGIGTAAIKNILATEPIIRNRLRQEGIEIVSITRFSACTIDGHQYQMLNLVIGRSSERANLTVFASPYMVESAIIESSVSIS